MAIAIVVGMASTAHAAECADFCTEEYLDCDECLDVIVAEWGSPDIDRQFEACERRCYAREISDCRSDCARREATLQAEWEAAAEEDAAKAGASGFSVGGGCFCNCLEPSTLQMPSSAPQGCINACDADRVRSFCRTGRRAEFLVPEEIAFQLGQQFKAECLNTCVNATGNRDFFNVNLSVDTSEDRVCSYAWTWCTPHEDWTSCNPGNP